MIDILGLSHVVAVQGTGASHFRDDFYQALQMQSHSSQEKEDLCYGIRSLPPVSNN